MIQATHPTRAPEFLSRFHDGELSAEETSAFESHRASCAECRAAVEDFERTLSLYRAAPTRPPASDLSARILRKVRAQSPSRRPFGVMFGIDIRWAGAFIAALLIVVMAAPTLLRRPVPQTPAAPGAIRAYVVEGEVDRKDLARENQPAAPAMPSERLAGRVRPAPKREARGDEKSSAVAQAPASRAAAPGKEGEEAAQRNTASAKRDAWAATAMASREAPTPEGAGGEAGASSASETKYSSDGAVHIRVRAADGEGAAPTVAESPSQDQLAGLRGQEFVLVVETHGRVREVQPLDTRADSLSKQKASAADANKASDPSQILRDLRFQPGDRPRRLVVRIE